MSLLQINMPFTWGPQQQLAFNELKVFLATTPVLQIPNLEYNFVLESNASTFTVGAALMQDQGDGLQPVTYFCKKLSNTETRYAPYEVELLAIVTTFEKLDLMQNAATLRSRLIISR